MVRIFFERQSLGHRSGICPFEAINQQLSGSMFLVQPSKSSKRWIMCRRLQAVVLSGRVQSRTVLFVVVAEGKPTQLQKKQLRICTAPGLHRVTCSVTYLCQLLDFYFGLGFWADGRCCHSQGGEKAATGYLEQLKREERFQRDVWF